LSGVGASVRFREHAQDQRLSVAAELDTLAPSPELDELLEDLSPGALSGEDLAAHLRACARQQARGAARTLIAMHHLGRARGGSTDRYSGCDEFSGDEVAATMCWSPSMAARKLGLAEDLEVRLPAVGLAVWEGRLDLARASRFGEYTRDLPDDLARHAAEVLLPDAASMPIGELIDRIEQVAIALDPDWAARREARARRNGWLILTPNPPGRRPCRWWTWPPPPGWRCVTGSTPWPPPRQTPRHPARSRPPRS
jgi:hypothetical protein